MKLKLISMLIMFISLDSFAQPVKPVVTDDLLPNKAAERHKYFPMANNAYLFKMNLIPPDSFIKMVNNFKASFNPEINSGHDDQLKELQKKDIDYYCRYLIFYDYINGYGIDSAKLAEFGKFRATLPSSDNYKQRIDSAYKNVYVKKLTPEESAGLEEYVWGNPDLDDAELFKRSLAYRNWLSDYYMFKVRGTKYKAIPGRGGWLGNPAGMLIVVNNEVKSTFIREYYASRMVNSIIKQVKDTAVKEKAYHDFMAVVTDPYYKEQVTGIYNNYKNMISRAPAPDFTYTDINGKQVSLKDLRGKYVYIDVWATWCAPCKAGLPFLAKIEDEYRGKNIQFVSLDVDKIANKPEWASYVKEHNLPGIQLMADNDFNSDFIRKFNVNSIPRCILIDPAGNIVSGDASDPTSPELRKQLDALVK
ncbi:TlpA family protein disulfide reductase [Mucilaginibacter paludis]|uniref:Redoxin domain protein n=1 Tax=Mucilaginibacter paludis DSM 18603 TaxID=714943 RepID=H1YA49_9SPHI|nr:TlpA disulfide reductase family protein [Mucilaginibacter paludis]EHQ25930.1 Redoxin domain protein [Mucilaginibacter paludis DSM 18603]